MSGGLLTPGTQETAGHIQHIMCHVTRIKHVCDFHFGGTATHLSANTSGQIVSGYSAEQMTDDVTPATVQLNVSNNSY